ncbi:MAG: DUF2974 domain-containing protein [Spirochaetaceae bacterium]|jgi:hypothetical protein|nr:DUF2974 domain-containing protein [Spirochaetaceae bacterium]
MANVFDYLDWRGDLSFKAAPFNGVDNIIFSIISYYPFDGIVGEGFGSTSVPLPEAVKKLYSVVKRDASVERLLLFGQNQIDFLGRLAEVPRYHECGLCGYVNKVDVKNEMQFSALTITIPDFPAYVAFRGTDAAIVAWKEDFNMILNDTIPAQLEAVSYLKTASKNLRGRINTGGHSKGGNLAVYAASFCGKTIQNRIKTVYSNDAPGFSKTVITSEQYKNIEEKIDCYIPQSSVIGMLFEYVKKYKVVKSSRTGIMQHDPFSWEIKGKDMVYIDAVSKRSVFVNKTLMQWLEKMDQQTRTVFVETLFTVLDEANIKSIPDFTDNAFKNTARLIKSLHNVDGKTKRMLGKMFYALFKMGTQNMHLFFNAK